MNDVIKQLVEALEWCYGGEPVGTAEAIQAGKKLIAELESQDTNPIKDGWKLSIANGHSGYGVYAHMEEYPEEGAFLLLSIKELESQTPVAWRFRTGTWWNREVHWRYVLSLDGTEGLRGLEPLYTYPPQRKPLTDEQIVAINDKHYNIAYRDFDADIAIARAIEAAHGIKE